MKSTLLHVGDIELSVDEVGDGPPVILLHGFPELAYSWRHQLPALAAAGFRAIAPDQRGYGSSEKPDGVEPYAHEHLVNDVFSLADALDIDRFHLVGHDWGSIVAFTAAVTRPERLLTGAYGRIRDVRAGPDGHLYFLTDSSRGILARLEPR